MKLDVPAAGVVMRTTTIARYQLIDRETGRVAYSTDVESDGRVTGGEAFLGVTTKYDTSAKAPDALLRLGQSLAALKEKEAACAAFGEITRKYPKASNGVKQSVGREQKRVGC